jgi:hypothetical protein
VIGLPVALALSLLVAPQAPAPAPPPPAPAVGAIDRAFGRLYNFDFPGALAILDEQAHTDPSNPLIYSVQAGTYLFMEMDRLKVLQFQFFLDNDNMVDGTAGLKPDPAVRARLFAALTAARARAQARLATSPRDVDALFAMCMAAGVETDYTALVENRTWRSLKLARETTKHADTLLALRPPFYDAYLNFGSLEYVVGSLPFFIRWFVHYDGVEGSKQRGIEQLKLTAHNGRYYGPFAKILLAVVSLREKKAAEAEKLLSGLAQEFPENELFKRELVRVSTLAKKGRQ